MNLLSIIRVYNPIKEGSLTKGGLRLHKHPSLDEPPQVKYAVFSDKRVFNRKKFDKVRKLFEDFLPEGFYFRGGPLNENAFEFSVIAADINNQRDPVYEEVNSNDFVKKLKNKGYDRETKEPFLGDIIAYYFQGGLNVYTHAGVYFGNGVVRSIWGENGPLVEHPILEVLPLYIGYYGALDIPESIDRGLIKYDVFRRDSKENKSRDIPLSKSASTEVPVSQLSCYESREKGSIREEECTEGREKCEDCAIYRGRIILG
jgi:hypothetical protein